MLPSKRIARERKLLLAVVAVASGVTISCSEPGGIGLYNPGWDAAFEDAANKDAANDAPNDAPIDATLDASDDAADADVPDASSD